MEKIKQALEALIKSAERVSSHLATFHEEVPPSQHPCRIVDKDIDIAKAVLSELEGSKPTGLTVDKVMEVVQLAYTDGLAGMRGGLPIYRERLEGMVVEQPKEPPRYVRSGPPVQMQDVLLACGELNERERVAVQWVLDKINELPDDVPELEYTAILVNALRGGPERMRRLVRDLTDRLPPEQPKEQGAEPVPSAREKAMEEAECTFYRDGDRIVQRLRGRDEFGDPQVTEHYMPVEAAIAMHEELGSALLSERSKPSLMVGFSEEEIIGMVDEYRENEEDAVGFEIASQRSVGYEDALEWVLDKINEIPAVKPTDEEIERVALDKYMKMNVRFAGHPDASEGKERTIYLKPVSPTPSEPDTDLVDRIMEVVREWLTHDGREPDNTRQQPMPMSDLRERLMKMAALP